MRRVSPFAAIVAVALGLASPCLARADEDVQSATAFAAPAASDTGGAALARARARALMPQGLSFEANRGQADPAVRFLARGAGYRLFLTADEAVLVVHAPGPPRAEGPMPARRGGAKRGDSASRSTVVRMRLAGANPAPDVVGLNELPGKAHHFVGHDPAQWRTDVPRYARVQYTGVYPGVDLVYYAGARGELEYDFVVAPGADPAQIGLVLEGGDAVALDARGDVVLRTAGGEVRLRRPLVYQVDPVGGRRIVESRYVLSDAREGSAERRLAFRVAPHDATRPLVIDPVVEFSTFLGGGNSFGSLAEGVAVDRLGSVYVTGWTYSNDFPVRNAYQSQLMGTSEFSVVNAFVTKFDAGGALIYSTYLGSADTYGIGIAVDEFGNAYVAGQVFTQDFPTTPGAYRRECGSATVAFCSLSVGAGDIFVTKLNRSGSALLYSTFLGARPVGGVPGPLMGIAVDSEGHAHVAGDLGSPDFPTVNAFQPQPGDSFGADVFVVKLNAAGTAAVYSTFLGGSDAEERPKVAVDQMGNAYVGGSTASVDFPTKHPMQASFNGGAPSDGSFVRDGFITKLDPSGSLIYSTYLGGTGDDLIFDINVDAAGSAYVVGITQSPDFPVRNPIQVPVNVDNFFAFYFNFASKLSPDGSALVYSTYFGTTNVGGCQGLECIEQANGVAVDAAGNAYITGLTRSPDFPVTSNAFQPQAANVPNDFFEYADAFLVQIDPTGTVLRYSTFLGGSNEDFSLDIAEDGSGGVYIAGSTDSPNFPTRRAFQPELGIDPDFGANAFVTRFSFSEDERAPLEFVTFPAVLPSLPPTAVLGQPYLGNVGIGGGRPPYRVRLVRGALPAGLRLGLQGAGGGGGLAAGSGLETSKASLTALEPGDVGGPIVDGTPTEPGDACFAVSVTDAVDSVGVEKTFRITTLGAGPAAAGTRVLQLGRAGSGGGRIGVLTIGAVAALFCDGDCVRTYAACDDVQLIAEADPGSTFAGWSGGGCAGTGECRVLMSQDFAIAGRFEAYPRLTVRREGSGEGRVDSVPGGIACGAQCEAGYEPGTVVRLTATAGPQSTFAGWSGGCSGAGSCEVTVGEPVEVRARFEREGTLGLVAAILPSSRSVRVGTPATVSATVIATGVGLAVGCTVGVDGSVPVTLAFQPYDAGTGQPTGPVNAPVTLTPGVPQALLLSVTPTAAFPAIELVPRFACANAGPATPLSGVNTLWISAENEAPADVVVLVSTPSNDGIVRVSGVPGVAAFALATVNVGAGDELTLTADTGNEPLPIGLLVCETTATGQCVSAPATSVRRRIETGQTPTYTVLVTATGAIAADAASHRVHLRFRDAAGALRGAASVAVQSADVTIAAEGDQVARGASGVR